jgi:hypothetical protein
MGGGLMQLVAYGAQDIYLTSNPQITFFKVVYRRHTNFAIESIEQTFNGAADFGKKVTCTVSRNGDLIHKVYLQAKLGDLGASSGSPTYADDVGHRLIKEITIEIGGQQIDKHYGEWLSVWNELTQTAERSAGYDEMIGKSADDPGAPGADIYVPLQFWFCRNPGLALPLIALQYHEVKFNLTFASLAECLTSPVDGPTGSLSASLWVDYIYLDTDERRQFAQVQHEYLIEQLQFTGSEAITNSNNKIKLAFNHPCKELIWTLHNSADADDFGPDSNLTSAKLQLNGHDRFAERPGSYFNLVQPYQHHTRVPGAGIYVYSFALNPEQHQPSGSVNMSRIDNATLHLTASAAGRARVYAVNYNVLRVMSGMGGLAYSN